MARPVEVPEGLPGAAPVPVFAARAATVEEASPPAKSGMDDDIFGKIEKLAALHAKGILTDDEFQGKKADLLSRL